MKQSTSPLSFSIVKRGGSVVPYDEQKIATAVEKAMHAAGEVRGGAAERVAVAVTKKLLARRRTEPSFTPTVEGIQDLVEAELMLHRLTDTAKAYILYRERHQKLRVEAAGVSDEVRELVHENKKYFHNQLAEFVFYSTYARWLDEKGRRETWTETIDRYLSFMKENLGQKLRESEYAEIREYMVHMRVMGSMRLLWSAGAPARATNVCVYNCSFIAPSSWQDFAEIMYVSMCGTGVGFSVERQTVEELPLIKRQTGKKLPAHASEDSKEGGGDALAHGMRTWAAGMDVVFDYGKIRPRGARLKTMGGRASGPEPLRSLLDFVRERMLLRQGRHLATLDVHDIVCKIGEIVVAGGVRRSALISLSDLDDTDMRTAKNGQFYFTNPQRSMANNSAVYNEKPTMEQFLDEWHNLVVSGSGERGIFNRGSLKKQLPARRWRLFEPDFWTSGTNPCGEIILKSKQFCNLSEVIVRPEDTEESLMDKVRIATILGTYQASLTRFPYLSPAWKKNCEEEALLGVSMTGQWDNATVRDPQVQRRLKEVAIETNRKYAKRFGIQPATAITCVKPSGNGSQLFDCASGMHPRHAKYYVRRIRIEGHNPLKKLVEDEGVPCVPEVGQSKESATTWVLEFPVKAPEGAIVKGDLTADDQLEYWKMLKEHYCEHNPSVTISVASDEWLEVGNWVYRHWDLVGGLSFLPKSQHIYQLAPYEEITEERYHELAARFPTIDFSKLILYEKADMTTGAKEYACVAGICEVDPVAPTVTETEPVHIA
ncbi:MAG: ATP cone domain-containing protein [Patescibacteria group bacterium]